MNIFGNTSTLSRLFLSALSGVRVERKKLPEKRINLLCSGTASVTHWFLLLSTNQSTNLKQSLTISQYCFRSFDFRIAQTVCYLHGERTKLNKNIFVFKPLPNRQAREHMCSGALTCARASVYVCVSA